MFLLRIICCNQSKWELERDKIQIEAQMVNKGADGMSGSLEASWQAALVK